jgi:hypothetical protein
MPSHTGECPAGPNLAGASTGTGGQEPPGPYCGDDQRDRYQSKLIEKEYLGWSKKPSTR